MAGKLYLVATPIGNLDDITLRAVSILGSVDVIACEDTRHSRKLLSHLNISKPLVSYHEHNEMERSREIIASIIEGRSVAVISDAGTPAVSDPGYRVVTEAIANGIDVIPIPGAAAFLSAAIVSGLPTSSIFYGGFLPSKASDRRKRLEEVSAVPATLVFYESPHRLARSLEDCLAVLGDRLAAVARELTKLHEEVVRGTLSELAARYADGSVKGEIVLVISGETALSTHSESTISISERVAELESAGLDHKAALKAAAKELGISRSEAYRRVQAEKS